MAEGENWCEEPDWFMNVILWWVAEFIGGWVMNYIGFWMAVFGDPDWGRTVMVDIVASLELPEKIQSTLDLGGYGA